MMGVDCRCDGGGENRLVHGKYGRRFLMRRNQPKGGWGSRTRRDAMLESLESRLLITAVTQYHVNLQSTGVDSTETILTPANVGTLSKQFSTPVDGQVYG